MNGGRKIVNGILGAVVVGLRAATAPKRVRLGDSSAIPALRSVAWNLIVNRKNQVQPQGTVMRFP
jgi:hypothetical protein